MNSDDMLVIALVKGSHRFIVIYNDGQEPLVRETLCRWAFDGRLRFTWKDAAVMNQRLSHQQFGVDSK